jgi:hypothetical protein
VASLPLGGDAYISLQVAGRRRVSRADATNSSAGEDASVNACADQMLILNVRLISLAGYDMREATTAFTH